MKLSLISMTRSRGLFVTLFFLGLFAGGILWACQVPVFRYALERWPADAYELVCVPAQGGLNAKEEAALKFLREAARDEDFPANITVRVDAEGENNSSAARMDLFYPIKMRGILDEPIWSGDATLGNAQKVVQSPLRKELTKRILTGESAIWLLVESGDPKKDDAAEKALIEHAEKTVENLKLPDGVVGKNDTEKIKQVRPGDEANVLQSDVPLKIEFSVLRISRLDLKEQVFLEMLLNLESDLGEYSKEPMAFPVFGRGRIIEPLIGLGLNYNNVIEHSAYLTGACSCEVKDENPGIDLLIAMNWDAAMEGSQVIIDKMLPPLEGTAALMAKNKPQGEAAMKGSHGSHSASAEMNTEVAAQAGAEDGKPAEDAEVEVTAEAGGSEKPGMPLLPLILIVGVVVVVIGAGTVMLKKNAD
ncbi:MAG: hypothetical protein L3J39_01330 [Verrucomicrobiales bacterium]|nr:hypothetical protein [Verrucomicrobiales bacterium]